MYCIRLTFQIIFPIKHIKNSNSAVSVQYMPPSMLVFRTWKWASNNKDDDGDNDDNLRSRTAQEKQKWKLHTCIFINKKVYYWKETNKTLSLSLSIPPSLSLSFSRSISFSRRCNNNKYMSNVCLCIKYIFSFDRCVDVGYSQRALTNSVGTYKFGTLNLFPQCISHKI